MNPLWGPYNNYWWYSIIPIMSFMQGSAPLHTSPLERFSSIKSNNPVNKHNSAIQCKHIIAQTLKPAPLNAQYTCIIIIGTTTLHRYSLTYL